MSDDVIRGNNGLTPITFQQGREISALQATVSEQGRSLGRSLDEIRDMVREMQRTMATKDDLVKVAATCPKCPEINAKLGRVEDTLYGNKNGEPGLVKDVASIKDFVLRASTVVTILVFLLIYILPHLLKLIGLNV